MNSMTMLVRKGWAFLTKPDDVQREILAESRPFLVFLTIVLTASFAVIVVQKSSLREPGTFFLLTFLMILHLLIHWISGWSILDLRLGIAYLLVQGVLAVGIVLISGEAQIGFGLFAALLGEVIGIFGLTRLALFGSALYIVLQPVSFFLVGGMAAVRQLGPMTLGINVILIVMMILIRRSLDSGDRAKELLSELEESHGRLAEYAAQVEALTLKEERARMARDLHDTLAQGLAGLVMQLEAAQHHLSIGNTERSTAIIGQAMDRARSTLASAREAIDDLRSQQDAPLGVLVRERVERFATSTGIRSQVNVNLPDDFEIDPSVRDHADHILGECLANTAVHAQAKLVQVTLSAAPAGFRLDVTDDGIGFEPNQTRKPGHYGLVGMRERVRLAGGSLEIESAPGRGSTITVYLPHAQRATSETA